MRSTPRHLSVISHRAVNAFRTRFVQYVAAVVVSKTHSAHGTQTRVCSYECTSWTASREQTTRARPARGRGLPHAHNIVTEGAPLT
jgi:hypothetical protein